jgi:hypothetical protein
LLFEIAENKLTLLRLTMRKRKKKILGNKENEKKTPALQTLNQAKSNTTKDRSTSQHVQQSQSVVDKPATKATDQQDEAER